MALVESWQNSAFLICVTEVIGAYVTARARIRLWFSRPAALDCDLLWHGFANFYSAECRTVAERNCGQAVEHAV